MDRWFHDRRPQSIHRNDNLHAYYHPPPNNDATPHHLIWATELWADTMLVNGKVYPFLNVEPRLYRFRTLNACNARFLNISFRDDMARRNLPFFLIGTDQGFLQRPVKVTSVLKGNAERHDILVEFEGLRATPLL